MANGGDGRSGGCVGMDTAGTCRFRIRRAQESGAAHQQRVVRVRSRDLGGRPGAVLFSPAGPGRMACRTSGFSDGRQPRTNGRRRRISVRRSTMRQQQFGPCLSADGLSLYFSTIGSTRVWAPTTSYVTKRVTRDGPWGPPVNLGPGINTTSDDVNPYIISRRADHVLLRSRMGHPGPTRRIRASPTSGWSPEAVRAAHGTSPSISDGSSTARRWTAHPSLSHDGLVLFFNSNRAGGVGQWDIWISTRKTTQDPWGPPVNAGAPVNSEAWDGNASLSADGRTLYYSSARGRQRRLYRPVGSAGRTRSWTSTATARSMSTRCGS